MFGTLNCSIKSQFLLNRDEYKIAIRIGTRIVRSLAISSLFFFFFFFTDLHPLFYHRRVYLGYSASHNYIALLYKFPHCDILSDSNNDDTD